ncbi:MAG TPA: ATP synthase F1 subunit epsilon [Chthoniobacterales bacterium]
MLQLEIVTPDHRAYSDAVDMVVIPAVEGEMGILPLHIPLMTTINPGELAVVKGGKTDYMAVGGGFVEVTASSVTVVTDMAVAEERIDEAAVQEAIDRAEARLKETNLEGEELATVEASIQRSLAQLHVKRRRHS